MPFDAKRVQAAFLATMETADPAKRAAILDHLCEGDAELRRRVDALLAAHDQQEMLPQVRYKPIDDTLNPSNHRPGAIIAGRYKLLEQIGEGGMGAVWVAEQSEPVRRRVALKLIKPGMDTKQVLSRFAAERQALALMDHPNIAKVYDGGMTEEGRPFFVMEYVKGLPITDYCDQARLSIEERLKLFLPVCQAVQHAHQKGIIHRDLKPSNLLVCLYDGRAVPKVIDFGLAKAISQPLTEHTLYTAHGLMVGTPLYMSPEQAEFNNLDVDTRTDIYSLGVILYELLTGTTPLEKQKFKEAAFAEILHLIKEVEPPKPSTKLSASRALPAIAAQRGLEPAQLSRVVRGELDWIVMKSLEKERSRRYETASSFAQDVQRFLNHEAILARPQSSLYRLRKFAQRNKAAVASGTAIAAALLLGTAVSAVLAIQAVHQRNQAGANLIALKQEQVKTEEEREKAVTEAKRAVIAERRAAEQKQLAEKRAKEAEHAQTTEAELRKSADERRRDIERQSQEITRLMQDQRRAIYAAEMNLVRLEAQRGNLARMRELLMQQIPGADDEDLRGWEWTYWYRFLHRAEVVYRYEGFVYNQPNSALAVAPEGKLAAATRGERTEWIDLATGKVIGSVPVRLRLYVNRNSLSRGGRLVEAAAQSQAAFRTSTNTRPARATQFAVWEPTGEKRTFPLPEELSHLSFVQLSDDGSLVAAVGNDAAHQPEKPASRLLVWDVETGELLLNQVQHQELNRLALSADGKLLLAYVCHGSLRNSDELREVAALLHVASGQVLGTVRHNDDIDTACVLPGGQRVLLSTLGFSGSNRKDLLLWNVGSQTAEKLTTEIMPDYVKAAVSPDGRLFAVAGHTVSKVRIFEIDGGRLIATLHNEATTIESLTFTADSQQLIASSTTGEVLRWDLNQDNDLFRLRAKPLGSLAYSGYALSPDQSLLAYASATGSVRLRAPDGTETILDPGNPDAMRGEAQLAFSPEGRYLAYSTDVNPQGKRLGSTQIVDLYDVAKARRIWRDLNSVGNATVRRMTFTPAQQHLLLEPNQGPIVRLDCADGAVIPLPHVGNTRLYGGMWSDRTGQLLMATRTPSISRNVKVIVRDLLTGLSVGEAAFPGLAQRYNLIGSPDGQHVAIVRWQPDSIEIWDFRQSQLVLQAPGNGIVFSSDGRRAAIGEALTVGAAGIGEGSGGISRFKTAQIWDMQSLQPVSTISLAGNLADELRFSPDGRRLLTLHGLQAMGVGGAIPEVRLWDIASGREIMSIPVAEVNHYMWDVYYDRSGNRLTILVFSKPVGTSGGLGSTILDATPLSESEDAELIARRRVRDLLRRSPLPSDAIAALQADPKLNPAVREAAVALARRQPVSPDALASFCIDAATQFESAADLQQAALRCAEALRDREPKALRSHMLLGAAQFRAGKFQEALSTLDQAAKIPDAPQADDTRLYRVCGAAIRALVQQALGNTPEARRDFNPVVAEFRAQSWVNTNLLSLTRELVNEAIFSVGPVRQFGGGNIADIAPALSRTLFERMDSNRDQQLAESELTLRNLNWSELVAQDKDRDGQLTLAEFTAAMEVRMTMRREIGSFFGPSIVANEPTLDYDQQLEKWNSLIEQTPENAWALVSRASLLAACPDERLRDGRQALQDATRAIELTEGKNPLYFNIIAMAHAELLDFDAAVKYQERGLAGSPPALQAELTTRLELFRQQKPYRLPGRYEAIEGWGRSVDPLGDCDVVADARTMRIKVPGSMHNLDPLERGTDAPRVLQEVEGDFTAEVKVTCPIQPQNSLPGMRMTYHGAGLLVYSNASHFLRVERDGYLGDWDNSEISTNPGRSRLTSNAPTIEYWQEGRIAAKHTSWDSENPQLPGESTWLRIERRGTTLRILLSHDGQAWSEVQKIETTFPPKIQLGVHAINNSADAFEATFSDWKLAQP